jgi:hypothetical protein
MASDQSMEPITVLPAFSWSLMAWHGLRSISAAGTVMLST